MKNIVLTDELFTKVRIYNKKEIIFAGYKHDLISLIKYNLKQNILDENISIKELIENYCPKHWTYKETEFEDIESDFDEFIRPWVERQKLISDYFNKKISKGISKEFVINELTNYLDNKYELSDEEIEIFETHQSYYFYKNEYLLEKITPYLISISVPEFEDYQSEIKFYTDLDSSINENEDLLLLHFKNDTYIFYQIIIDNKYWHICKNTSELSETTRKILFTEVNKLFR